MPGAHPPGPEDAPTAGTHRPGVPEHIPFPVEAPFTVRADMRRWSQGDAGHLRLDARYPDYLVAKLDALARDAAGCRAVARGLPPRQLALAVAEAAERLGADLASRGSSAPFRWGADGLEVPTLGLAVSADGGALRRAPRPPPPGLEAPARRAWEHLVGLPPAARLLDALALAVQEDLVWMGPGTRTRGPAATAGAGHGSADVLHVCFPSGWDPGARAGASFEALHRPVPGRERLEGASAAVMRALLTRGPFVRYVWSLAPSGALGRNPRHERAAQVDRPEALWYRAERQTTAPLPRQGRALFTIRVYTAPLPRVLAAGGPGAEGERRARLAAALRSMDEPTAAYKGVAGLREEVLDWLEGAAPGA